MPSNAVTPELITKPVDMSETTSEHFQRIADEIDSYDRNDREFMLWYLLGNYREYLQEELDKKSGEPKDVVEFAERRIISDHMRWSEDIRNVLQYSIW